jgi:hypothetical protein
VTHEKEPHPVKECDLKTSHAAGATGVEVPAERQPPGTNLTTSETLENGDKDWSTRCLACGATPTLYPTGLCGPCCTGEAETAGGNW